MAVQMIQTALLDTAEQSLNLLLRQDHQTLARLDRLSGRVIRIEITEPEQWFYLLPHGKGLDLLSHFETEPDLILRGTCASLLQMAQSENSRDLLFGKGVEVEGDQALASEFKKALAGFAIDWEEWLGDLLGDTLAHPLAELFRAQKQFLQQSGQSLTLNMTEYLQEEARVLPPRAEIEGFIEEVGETREAVDRLEARINRLIVLAKTSVRKA
ncbi:ubiquinone biosynthesis accessory factor UbiJ [Nitrincola alkalilacustris]|uniref:ubiquinone biosynthesis accessory factor UbiJ n=1 Tax=Nitrincola alkalilacustris TaxID=1571224 RepID=UPI00124DF420|nr:SCP2 sterol-binding domain-containing protein [Nitrincola alkalilacustris]